MYYLNTKKPLLQFQKATNSKVYVDKSRLIEKISDWMEDGNSYICITRPRRFGKTTNVQMLGAYFTKGYDSSEIFDSMEIAGSRRYQQHKNQYNVISIDFSEIPDVCRNYQEYIHYILENLKRDLREVYPFLSQSDYGSIRQMLFETEDSFVFLLDEWDFVFYQSFMTEADKSAWLQFLKGLLKDQPYVELAYMTGVLPIRKYSSGSELNMFLEFNALNDDLFEDYFGLNEEEVKELCRKHQTVSYEELAFWYDGYYLSDGRHLFNPRSVSCAISVGSCRNYWTETGPMNEIAECIEHNVDEVREDILKMVAGIPIEVELNGYSAAEQRLDTRDEILSAMVVYGFLSYHDGYLRIPNQEVRQLFWN